MSRVVDPSFSYDKASGSQNYSDYWLLATDRCYRCAAEFEVCFDGSTGRSNAYIEHNKLVVGEVLIGVHRFIHPAYRVVRYLSKATTGVYLVVNPLE